MRWLLRFPISLLLVGVLGVSPTRAAIFTVNSTADDDDAVADGVCATAAGACTLRAAIQESNASAGVYDTIDFNLPGTAPHTILVGAVTSKDLPVITDPVEINGYSQPDASSNTLPFGDPKGDDAVLTIVLRPTLQPDMTPVVSGSGLAISAGSSTIKGLVVVGFVGDGIFIVSGDNLIAGNFIGTTGSSALGNGGGGIFITGPHNTIGGSDAAARNLISSNSGAGIEMSDAGSTRVLGNFIGTNQAGTAALGNTNGVIIDVCSNIMVDGNLISGNSGNGVFVTNASFNFVQNNTILDNGFDGVLEEGGGDNTIANNVIMSNGRSGVHVAHVPVEETQAIIINGNSIAANGSLRLVPGSLPPFGIGIDLGGNCGLGPDCPPDGVTPNDPIDADTGPNGLQNFPVLNSVMSSGGMTTVAASLNSTPNSPFTLEFFANTACDPSGFGEGQSPVTSKDVMTDASGNATVTVGFPTAGAVITATATGASGTSEFSRCATAAPSTGRCPRGVGFWKNHPELWPVTTLTLGSQSYTQTQLLNILKTPGIGPSIGPGGGSDASLILARPLIAAKLNIANGSDPTPIAGTIADADNLLSSFTGMLPYQVSPMSATGQLMTKDANLLEAYDKGSLTFPCTP